MIKMIVFDWDGTLCDSIARIIHCVKWAARAAGAAEPEDHQIKEVIGLGLKEALITLFPTADLSNLDSVRQRYIHHFTQVDKDTTQLYPLVRETLHTLKQRGYILTVATGKGRLGLDQALKQQGLSDFFHASRCADETRSKPHPLMLEQLLAQFNLYPHQAVMIGDTEFDLEMAKRIEMPRIGVSYGAHAAHRLHQYGLLGCADQFDQILEWL